MQVKIWARQMKQTLAPWHSSTEDDGQHQHTHRQLLRRQRSSRGHTQRSRRRSSVAWLESPLPVDATFIILRFLDHQSLHACELTSRIYRDAIISTGYWRTTIVDRLACYDDPLHSERERLALWKRMHCMKQRHAGFTSDALLTGVVANDSPNAFSVPPTWLLFKSRCWIWMEKLLLKTADTAANETSLYVRQLHCGCGYHVPCFWSSGGSLSQDACSTLDFTVRGDCFLSSIQVVPYQAYWVQGLLPAFAPKRISFSLYHHHHSEPWFQSPVYPVKNEMVLQKFDLPKTVWISPGCTLRVHLLGRTQRAPLVERPWIPAAEQAQGAMNTDSTSSENAFFCCLSYLNATGFVVQENTGKKPRRWWQPSNKEPH